MNSEDLIKKNKFAAVLSILSNATLIVLKIIAGLISQSISVISEAIHSLSDLLASIITFFAVSYSAKPADDDHPYGHGKFEELSGLIEGILIILISFYILYEAVRRIVFSSYQMIDTDLALCVMIFSIVTNFLVSGYLLKTAKKTESIAIFADAQHLRADVFSSLAIVIALVLIKITGLHILDPIFAIIVAVWILEAGYKICKKTILNLLDTSLPENEQKIIVDCINEFKKHNKLEFMNLKTRKAGIYRDIEVTILICGNSTIAEGHILCDKIEHTIAEKLEHTSINIHLEPLDLPFIID